MKAEDAKYFVFEENDEFKKLIEYLYDRAECADKEIFKDGRKYILITKENIMKAVENKPELKKQVMDIYNDKHTCHNCGCISNIFIMDYRGQLCISKVYNCPFCHVLNDKDYNEVNQENLLKYR